MTNRLASGIGVFEPSNALQIVHTHFGPPWIRPWRLREKHPCFSRPETRMCDVAPSRCARAAIRAAELLAICPVANILVK
jgi:hypothetical protein